MLKWLTQKTGYAVVWKCVGKTAHVLAYLLSFPQRKGVRREDLTVNILIYGTDG